MDMEITKLEWHCVRCKKAVKASPHVAVREIEAYLRKLVMVTVDCYCPHCSQPGPSGETQVELNYDDPPIDLPTLMKQVK